MKLDLTRELSLGGALTLIGWVGEDYDGPRVTFRCRREHHNCTAAKGYYCIDEAFEVIAELRRKTFGISCPATPSGSMK